MTSLPVIHRRSKGACALLTVSVLGIAGPAAAQIRPGFPSATPPGPPSAENITRLDWRADRQTVAPGETVLLAAYFESRPAWHIYWQNPGEGAAAPGLEITVPDGFTVGRLQWPRPAIKRTNVGDTYIHEGRAALMLAVTAPADLDVRSTSPLTFTLHATWAVCDADMCLFGRGRRELSLLPAPIPAQHIDPDITRRAALLPLSGERARDAQLEQRGTVLHFSLPSHGQEAVTFFPYRSDGVEYGEAQIDIRDDRIHVTVPMHIRPQNFLDGPPVVGGLVALGTKPEDPSYELELRLQDGSSTPK